MAQKTDFSLVEWKKIIQSPLLAGFAVSAADPSSLVGSLQEAFTEARMLADAKASGDTLIKQTVEELMTSGGRADAREGIRTVVQGAQSSEIKSRALAALKETSDILDAKASSEAKAYKAWLKTIAKKVAEAGTEGGFLGFGGVKVSELEKATLADISKALGT